MTLVIALTGFIFSKGIASGVAGFNTEQSVKTEFCTFVNLHSTLRLTFGNNVNEINEQVGEFFL